MAERGGHAPQPAVRIDFLSTESRLACPVHVPFRARGRSCTCTGPILSRRSLLLDYTGIDDGAPGRIRTDTESGLSRLPLLLGYRSEMVPAAGVAPALAPF